MTLPKLHLRDLFWLVLVVALVGAGIVWLGGTYLPRSASYVVAAEYRQLPESDEALLEWIRQQPGVISHTVRARRTGERLEIGFMQSQNLFGKPAFPPLETTAASLGYAPEDAVFIDVIR